MMNRDGGYTSVVSVGCLRHCSEFPGNVRDRSEASGQRCARRRLFPPSRLAGRSAFLGKLAKRKGGATVCYTSAVFVTPASGPFGHSSEISRFLAVEHVYVTTCGVLILICDPGRTWSLEHKPSHKGQFCENEIYTSCMVC